MSQEIKDFEYFRDHQMVSVDFNTGILVTKGGKWGNTIYYDIGSENADGYIRLWCNGRLRMKHRLIFFLAYNCIPPKGSEIDHIDKNRSNNVLSNLCVASKRVNNSGSLNRKIGRFTKELINQVCHLLQNTELSDEVIANQTGVSRATVRDIKCRKSRQTISAAYSWPHRGY